MVLAFLARQPVCLEPTVATGEEDGQYSFAMAL